MQLANIVPPQWTGVFPQSNYRLAQAHWVLEYPKYAQKIRSPKAYVILDNGAFEGELVSYAELNEAAALVGADEVVLPDVLGDPMETLQQSWKALGNVTTPRVLFTPHAETYKDWSNCLSSWIAKWEESVWHQKYSLALGVNCLRAPNGGPQASSRLKLLERAAQEKYPVHLLGVRGVEAFASQEIGRATELGVRGVDTSLAFALAAEGILLTPTADKVLLGPPDKHNLLPTPLRRLVYLNTAILSHWVAMGEAREGIPTRLVRQVSSRWLKYWAEGFAPLTAAAVACGLPDGLYAVKGEQYLRPLGDGDALREGEVEMEVKHV